MEKGRGKAVGIAPRLAYNCVAIWQHDRVKIIANDRGNRLTPSYVAFLDTEYLIVDAASFDDTTDDMSFEGLEEDQEGSPNDNIMDALKTEVESENAEVERRGLCIGQEEGQEALVVVVAHPEDEEAHNQFVSFVETKEAKTTSEFGELGNNSNAKMSDGEKGSRNGESGIIIDRARTGTRKTLACGKSHFRKDHSKQQR
ncbi:hypothetical protein SUGI_1202010 [Cryptomeria japonica]|nr:hypothetical protein SUGI_1202010 [Cryptomeria japonica]